MGFWFDVVLYNTRTEEKRCIEVYRAGNYLEAWKNVTEEAITKFKETWDVEGDAKYWVIKSITDATRR